MPGNTFNSKEMLNIPSKVRLDHLQKNGKLYSDDLVEKIKGLDLPEGRTTKNKLLTHLNETYPDSNFDKKDVNFSIERHGDSVSAIYKGKSARDFFILESIPENDLQKYVNSYVFTLEPEGMHFIDAEAKSHQLEIHEQEKFDMLMKDFKQMPHDYSLRKALRDSPPEILQDMVDLAGANPGHERMKEGNFALGAGEFGSVKLMQNLTSGNWNVIKIMKSSDQEKLDIEKQNLMQLNQLEAAYQRINKLDQMQNEIVMKMASGVELQKFAFSGIQLPAAVWIDIASNMLTSLKEVHDHGVIHNDIKCENMMIDPVTKKVAQIDFGFSMITDNVTKGVTTSMDEYTKGTNPAPESHAEKLFNEKTELYQMGLAIGHALGFTPTEMHNGSLVNRDDGNFTDNSKIPDAETREKIFNLLEKMTDDDAAKRPALQEAIATLNQIRAENVDAEALMMQAVYLDINTFNKGSEEEKAAMIDSVAGVNEVWLIDKNGSNHDMLFYESIKRQLEANGLKINPEVIQPLANNVQAAMSEYAAQRETKDQLIYNTGTIANGKLVIKDMPEIAGKGFAAVHQNIMRAGIRSPAPAPVARGGTSSILGALAAQEPAPAIFIPAGIGRAPDFQIPTVRAVIAAESRNENTVENAAQHSPTIRTKSS